MIYVWIFPEPLKILLQNFLEMVERMICPNDKMSSTNKNIFVIPAHQLQYKVNE